MRSWRSAAWLAPLALLGCGRPVPGQLTAPPRADAVSVVQPATPEEIATALNFKADVGQLDQLSRRNDVGPVSANSAPPPDLLARTLPRALTPDQASQLLLSVPGSDVETGLGDRHVNFLAPFWGASYLGGFEPFGIGPLSYFPFSVFSAMNFFPYAYDSSVFFYPYALDAGLYYPSFCPFYFGAAAFMPYCQPPLVYYGTGVPVAPGLPAVVPPVAAGIPPIAPPIGAAVAPLSSPLDTAIPAVAPLADDSVAPPVEVPDIPPVAPPVVSPVAPLGAVPSTPLPVTVAEGLRPLLYFPGEVPVL